MPRRSHFPKGRPRTPKWTVKPVAWAPPCSYLDHLTSFNGSQPQAEPSYEVTAASPKHVRIAEKAQVVETELTLPIGSAREARLEASSTAAVRKAEQLLRSRPEDEPVPVRGRETVVLPRAPWWRAPHRGTWDSFSRPHPALLEWSFLRGQGSEQLAPQKDRPGLTHGRARRDR
eukprot:Skav211029  [mRNA]  locus=scaffold2434:161390:179121:+ [translate_table: standard]